MTEEQITRQLEELAPKREAALSYHRKCAEEFNRSLEALLAIDTEYMDLVTQRHSLLMQKLHDKIKGVNTAP